jgi:hypothetical protein
MKAIAVLLVLSACFRCASGLLPVGGTGPEPHGYYGPSANFNGGPVIKRPEVITLAYGTYKGQGVRNFGASNSFLADLPRTKYMSWIDKEYSAPNNTLKPGRLVHEYTVLVEMKSNVTEKELQKSIKELVSRKLISSNANGNALTMIFLPPGVTMVTNDGRKSCVDFCGYNSGFVINKRRHFYSVIPDPQCSAAPSKKRMDCQNGLSPIDATTATLSRLYVSAKINPEPPGGGWIARYYGDLVFLCTGQADRIKGPTGVTWVVQQFWHNGLRTCMTDPTRPYIKVGYVPTNEPHI